ncbi:MAG: KamA family radical SAM protein [Promethearchaeota archaeon]
MTKNYIEGKSNYSNNLINMNKLKQLDVDIKTVEQVIQKYPMKVNSYYLNLIKKKNDPIWKQCIPDLKELTDTRGYTDPLKEDQYSPVQGLVHRYPDRVLLLVSNKCAMYCRFCTRKRKVGKKYTSISEEDFKKAIKYIESHKEIRDVIISGGDPLLLDDAILENYIKNVLKKYPPIYFLTHFNHPREVTEEAKNACEMLAESGVVMGNQSVLLKGVNDDSKTLMKLNHELLKCRVRPYYLYIPDAVCGTAHHHVSIERALKIMEEMFGFTSGLAVPRLIIDLVDGGGKIPLCPNSIVERVDNKYIFKNFEGKKFTYNEN